MALIELLTFAARIALPTITGLVEAGMSANKIINTLQAAGLGVRRQVVLDIVGALRENFSAARQFRLLLNTTIPDPSKFGVALTNLIRNYSYKVRVSGGYESFPPFITISSNEVLNKDQIMGTADAYLSDERIYIPGEEEEAPPYSLSVVDALRSPALG
jgi:hypothetical protein